MKKLMKKISVILAIVLVVTTWTFNFGVQATEVQEADENLLTEGQIGLLQHLGIVPAVLPDMEHHLTRGELAQMAAKLMKEPAYTGDGDFFYDVYKDNPYRGDIYALAQAGILHGDGDGYFRPEEEISELEICKVFSVILGFEPIGQYDNYIRIAREAGVSNGLEADGVVTYEEAMLMAHNTLHCEMMEAYLYGENKEYRITKDYRAIERYHGLVKQEGVVEGRYLTTLSRETNQIAENHLLINDRQFLCDDETMLGKYVVFYSGRKSDGSTEKEIQYIYAHEGRNRILTLMGDAVSEVGTSEIRYFVGEKEKSIKITGLTDVVVNSIACPDYTEDDLKAPMATLTFIDNNDDGVYDVIFVDDPQYMIVGGVDKNNNMIYGKYPQITIGDSNRDTNLEVYMALGKTMLSMLRVGTAVSVSQSRNETGTLRIRVNEVATKVQGRIEKIMNNKITVAGKSFKMTDATVTDQEVRAGDNVIVYYKGDYAAIVVHMTNDAYQFGYMTGARNSGGGFVGKLSVKLVGLDRVLYEYDATNPMWIDEIKYTKADAAMTRLETAAKSRVFETSTAEGILNENARLPYSQPIRYKVNENGQITHIDTVLYEPEYELENSLRPNGGIRSAYYGSGSRSFYNGSANVNDFLFSAPDNGNIIMPPQENRDQVEWYGDGDPANGNEYFVEYYTVDPVNRVAEYVVAYNFRYEASDSSAIGVISDIYDSLDEEGEIVTVAEISNPRLSNKIILTGEAKQQWGLGDVVLYDYNTKNELSDGENTWRIMFDQSLGKDQTRVAYAYSSEANYLPSYYNLYTNMRVSYGTILSIKDGIITHVNAVVEDEQGITDEGFQNYRTDSVVVYVYEEINGKATMRGGSLSDIIPYNMNPNSGQKALIGTRSAGRLEYIVIYK